MTNSITQDNQNDNQISSSIRKFFTRFHLSSALKAANAYKSKGIYLTFKVCKSYLRLGKECNSLSYDAMSAQVAVVFTRYMMLSVENRESKDERSLGELFLYFTDELSVITWIQAFQVMLQMFSKLLSNDCELSENKISDLTDAFINTIPSALRERLKVV